MSTPTSATTVRHEIVVDAPIDRAFSTFTKDFGAFKPPEHNILAVDLAETVFEPRVGGRLFDRGVDGSECTWARVLAYEPPDRVVISWDLNSQWKPDTTVSSEVEVRFIAEGPNATLVELEHRKFERMGAEAGASMRKDVDGGWPRILEYFRQAAEAASG